MSFCKLCLVCHRLHAKALAQPDSKHLAVPRRQGTHIQQPLATSFDVAMILDALELVAWVIDVVPGVGNP